MSFLIALFASATAFLLLDQLSKSLVESHIGDHNISLGPLLQLKHVASSRRLYARNGARLIFAAIWVAAFASTIVLYQLQPTFRNPTVVIAIGAALGGAAGNLIDVMRRRSVSDFIDFRFWPTFNLADAAIVCGLIVAFWPAR
ncbi:MAG: signal peptidase II [Gemmatimonadaceae bacterium]